MYHILLLDHWDCGFEAHLGMDVHMHFSVYVLSFVGRGLVTGWYPALGVLPDICKQDWRNWRTWTALVLSCLRRLRRKQLPDRILKWILLDVTWIELKPICTHPIFQYLD